MPCCSGPTLLSLWPVLVGGSASCLAVLSTLHSLVRRWLCVWRTGRGLPGLAISVACGDRPVRWLVCAAALRDSSSAPDASLEHNRRFLFPPTPANSPPKKIRCPHWHSAASLHRSAPPSPAAEAAGHCRWFPALRTVPQSSDLHSPPACPCAQREPAPLTQKSTVRIGPRKFLQSRFAQPLQPRRNFLPLPLQPLHRFAAHFRS